MSYFDAESFTRNGFIIIPNVLSQEDVKLYRDVIENILIDMPNKKRMLFISDIFEDKNLTHFLIRSQCNDRITNVLKQIVNNEFTYVNDLQIQCSMFGIASGGWHFDANSEVNLQNGDYLHDKHYSFAKVGVYLQDNTFDFGGGIDVIPRSHKAFRHFGGNKVMQYFYARIVSKLMRMTEKFTSLTVPIKAGDAVIFDSRLLHRSSFPNAITPSMSDGEKVAERVSFQTMNAKHAKYSLYWEVGRKKDALSFLKNACKRAMTEEILSEDPYQEIFYTDYLQYSFPVDYPDFYKEKVDSTSGLTITSLDASKANFFKSILKR